MRPCTPVQVQPTPIHRRVVHSLRCWQLITMASAVVGAIKPKVLLSYESQKASVSSAEESAISTTVAAPSALLLPRPLLLLLMMVCVYYTTQLLLSPIVLLQLNQGFIVGTSGASKWSGCGWQNWTLYKVNWAPSQQWIRRCGWREVGKSLMKIKRNKHLK